MKDTKSDFCGEKTKRSYQATSTLLWDSSSLSNDESKIVIKYKNDIMKKSTLTLKLATFTKLTKTNWVKPETSFNIICHNILSSTLINRKMSEECAT